jgi:uncharacterized protein (TIGR03032 family)
METDSSETLVPADEQPLRSIHTSNLPHVLEHFGISLLVTTYQADKLIIVRADAGKVNTHFRNFTKPMGMAVSGNRMAIGTQQEISEFRNTPAVASRLDPAGKVDGCYLPRRTHFTGDIQIHEMAYSQSELWFINTAFSCLCTYDADHSFVPRWRPPFVTGYDPSDRCHLNGLGMLDGRPKWVTALGDTDTASGWRANKKDGGILMDVQSDEILVRGLSMPHSPRWYDGRLWLLESGNGSFGFVDIATGKVQEVVRLQGFTRGLDFCGNLAFIAVSQVRETAFFSGIGITERLQERERACGVWVVDLPSGNVIAFLKFEDAVQEIFSVNVLHGLRYPELINHDKEITGSTYVLPDDALKEVPSELIRKSQP